MQLATACLASCKSPLQPQNEFGGGVGALSWWFEFVVTL